MYENMFYVLLGTEYKLGILEKTQLALNLINSERKRIDRGNYECSYFK